MRTLSAAATAQLATKKGTKPINVIEIDWHSGNTQAYGDKAIPNQAVRGATLRLGEIDSVLDILNSNTSESVPFNLADPNGDIKNIFNTREIHQVPVRVYQYFEGTDYGADRFNIFSGKMSSPIEWEESSRSFSFTALSELEDKQFGFSAEEGQFPNIPADLVGKAWPSIFGTKQDVPALQINKAVTGSTLCAVGILSGEKEHLAADIGADDCGQNMSVQMQYEQISFLNTAAAAWNGKNPTKADQFRDQANQLRTTAAGTSNTRSQQVQCGETKRAETVANAKSKGLGCNPLGVLGGEDFLQGIPIKIEINGGIFTGTMNGDQFTISQRQHPESEDKVTQAQLFNTNTKCVTPTPAQFFDFQMQVPPGTGNVFLTPSGKADQIRRRGFIVCLKPTTSSPASTQILQHFWADAGSRVTRFGDEPISFIASITPGTVLSVRAWKEFNGERTLVDVPTDLYSVSIEDYGPIVATLVTTTKPLSTIEDQGWSDQIYVTFESTIGPNTVDVLEYIVDNYTDLAIDATSFSSVSADVDAKFPFNGAVLDRRNTVDVLRDIAYQAKLALWVRNGVVFLKYLPKEPPSDKTITRSEIEFETVKVTTVNTEDLVTDLNAEWNISIAQAQETGEFRINVRNNIDKFGTREQKVTWWIHTQPDVIWKAMTFWIIRQSFSYKRISFNGFLNLLALEPFDTVTLDFPDWVASSAVKGIVEEVKYDSARRNTKLTVLVPVRTGEMTPYVNFWPAGLDGSVGAVKYYPEPGTEDEEHAGGNGIGAGAIGELPIGDVSGINSSTVFIGGINVIWGPQTDRGDSTPGDAGFVPKDTTITSSFGNIIGQDNPNPPLSLNFIDPGQPIELPTIPSDATNQIDIRTTPIIDSEFEGRETILASFFRQISNDNILEGRTDSTWNDETETGQFAFKWRDKSSQFGAGIAFLE